MRDKGEEGEKSKIFTNNITTSKKAMGISMASVLIALSFASVLSPMTAAFAQTTVSCGDTITKSTTLTSDIGPCPEGQNGINIGADNIILDCRGHSITSSSGGSDEGVLIEGHSGVTITNCKSIGFENGFKLVDSSHNTLRTNIASKNSDDGFDIVGSSNTLTANTASENSYGFYLPLDSDHNILKLNTASNNGFGFDIVGSSNTLTANTARSNQGDGFVLFIGSSNTLTGNKADANTGYGYHDESQGGTGTKGTDNTYRLDECHGNGDGGSLPSGLCSPQR